MAGDSSFSKRKKAVEGKTPPFNSNQTKLKNQQ
jgi:hypothetical protein